MRDALRGEFVPVLAEHTADPGLVRRYEIRQFPSIVWTDAAGEAVAVTVRPESADDALRDLEAARAFLGAGPAAR